MPAATPGTVTQTWRDGAGATTIEVVYHYDPVTGQFDANPALSYVNNTGRAQAVQVYLVGGGSPLAFDMPAGTGSVTRSQVSAATGGQVTSFNAGGWTLDPVNL